MLSHTSAGGYINGFYKFHEYIKTKGWNESTSATDTAFNYAYNTKLHMFQYLQSHPPYGSMFNDLMGGYAYGRISWVDEGFYPVKTRLIEGLETAADAVLLVDVGGSVGHDMERFREKFPDVPGRLVVEDLPEVIAQIERLHSKIERVTYNFHDEQPVKCLCNLIPFSICANETFRCSCLLHPFMSA
jgi:hypothetical protein